jgi:hypothetical protein
VSLQDDAHPGQAHHVITPDVIAALDSHIRVNRRITSLFFFTRLHYWTTTFKHLKLCDFYKIS